MPYKKRRILKSPNKNEEKSRRNRATLPPLMSFYPEVERLFLDLQFSNQKGDSVRSDVFNVGSNDPVNFMAACPGECGDGRTNLQGKIEAMVRNRDVSGEGRAQCTNIVFLTGQPCGTHLKCQIKLVYRP